MEIKFCSTDFKKQHSNRSRKLLNSWSNCVKRLILTGQNDKLLAWRLTSWWLHSWQGLGKSAECWAARSKCPRPALRTLQRAGRSRAAIEHLSIDRNGGRGRGGETETEEWLTDPQKKTQQTTQKQIEGKKTRGRKWEKEEARWIVRIEMENWKGIERERERGRQAGKEKRARRR